MSKPSKQSSGSSPRTLKDAQLENYEVQEVHRSQLKGAPYNPRQLTDNQRRKLKAGLKRHGLVNPPTWNKRTGLIVGGHQRIAIMDSLMGSSDYSMNVAVIDVSESREKELNILLNNSMAQGQWDIEGLEAMLRDVTVDISGTGFEASDVYQLLGTSPFETRKEDAAKMAEQLAQFAELYDTIKSRNKAREGSEFYLVFVFKSEERASRFIMADPKKWEVSRYQNGEVLADTLGYDLNENMAPQGHEDVESGFKEKD